MDTREAELLCPWQPLTSQYSLIESAGISYSCGDSGDHCDTQNLCRTHTFRVTHGCLNSDIASKGI